MSNIIDSVRSYKEKSRWFERMKNRHKDSILKGAAKYVKSN